MAPERLRRFNIRLWEVTGPSRVGDVYSLAMVSFEVLSSVVSYPAT